jgi:hypothetical protein
MILPPGTPASDAPDARTVEQNEAIQFILAKNANKAVPKYSGWLILPDGTLTNNKEYLTIPADRALEIETALAAGTDPEKVSEPGNVLLLGVDGVPFQYVSVQSITDAIDSQSATDIVNEPEADTTIYLDSLVSVNNSTIVRQYTKGSKTAVLPATIELTNTSDTITVLASVNKIPGVNYVPSDVTLFPGATATMQLTFDINMIDALPEGVTTITTVVNLTAENSTPESPTVPTPAPVPTPVPSPPKPELPSSPKRPEDTTTVESPTIIDEVTTSPSTPTKQMT